MKIALWSAAPSFQIHQRVLVEPCFTQLQGVDPFILRSTSMYILWSLAYSQSGSSSWLSVESELHESPRPAPSRLCLQCACILTSRLV